MVMCAFAMFNYFFIGRERTLQTQYSNIPFLSIGNPFPGSILGCKTLFNPLHTFPNFERNTFSYTTSSVVRPFFFRSLEGRITEVLRYELFVIDVKLNNLRLI